MISLTTQQQIVTEWQRKSEYVNQYTEDMLHFLDTCKTEFAKYGHIECPLTDDEILDLYAIDGIDIELVFNIGDDVACGYDFDYAVQTNLGEQL